MTAPNMKMMLRMLRRRVCFPCGVMRSVRRRGMFVFSSLLIVFCMFGPCVGGCPYGWRSACCPLLLGGGARGGREKSGHNLFNKYVEHCLFRYHPRRCAPHPSFPKEGTTLGVRCVFVVVRADTGVCPYRWMPTTLVRNSPPFTGGAGGGSALTAPARR